jgi:hypothetical protein
LKAPQAQESEGKQSTMEKFFSNGQYSFEKRKIFEYSNVGKPDVRIHSYGHSFDANLTIWL